MEVSLARMLGRRVLDPDGNPVGRIEEAHAERRDGELVITEWVLGAQGLMERLGLMTLMRSILGRWAQPEPRVIGWTDLDLSDPEQPRLRRRAPHANSGRPRIVANGGGG